MQAAQFSKQAPLIMDPYLLGVYLGDGDGRGRICNPERDLLRRLKALTMPGDEMVTHHQENRCVSISYRKRSQKRTGRSSFNKTLAVLGLWGSRAETKFIPEAYLRASVPDRVKLLQGLCDTDGYVANQRLVEVSTASRKLSDGIRELVGSLGGLCSVVRRKTHYRKDGKRIAAQDAYRVLLRFPTAIIVPVSSKKHLSKWSQTPQRAPERFIHKVIPDGRARCR